MRFVLPTVCLLLGSSSILQGQVTVQQPVVGSTGVATSVSVPDRGTTFLGGVNSAASSRTSYGPVRTGTTRTSSLTATSITASVHIIDLQAMDEAILNSAPEVPTSMTVRNRSITSDRLVTERDSGSAVDKIAKFEKLALQAEAAGKKGLAKLHWQMAAKHGSTLAQTKLNPTSVPVAESTARK